MCINRIIQVLVVFVVTTAVEGQIIPGAYRTEDYFPFLKGKRVALVANHTSRIGMTHLLDTFLLSGLDVRIIFTPEHGFRGDLDAGERVPAGRDPKTGLPVIPLYGKKVKPSPSDLNGIDVVVFDIQDVGVRFYTYLSTLTYVMEACADNQITLLVLDRPNPNGFYIDGPVLEPACRSFVGLHPVPVVYGMTIGEYASMVNGERWLSDSLSCYLLIIPCIGYTHDSLYQLPIKPSPNLVDMRSVYLYPSLAFFEGTAVSVGRGTLFPFQVYGYPSRRECSFHFTPRSIPGMSLHPPYAGKMCCGTDLRNYDISVLIERKELILDFLIDAYNQFPDKNRFFNSYFDLLAGTPALREQIKNRLSEEDIRKSWIPGLNKFKEIRKKYLIYP